MICISLILLLLRIILTYKTVNKEKERKLNKSTGSLYRDQGIIEPSLEVMENFEVIENWSEVKRINTVESDPNFKISQFIPSYITNHDKDLGTIIALTFQLRMLAAKNETIIHDIKEFQKSIKSII